MIGLNFWKIYQTLYIVDNRVECFPFIFLGEFFTFKLVSFYAMNNQLGKIDRLPLCDN